MEIEEEIYDNLDPNFNQSQYFNKPTKKLKVQEDTITAKIRKFLCSSSFHTSVVVLVVIDCLCVTLELTIEHIEKYVLDSGVKSELNKRSTVTASSKLHGHIDFHFYFHIIENILKCTSIAILGLFVLEVIVKLIFVPKVFIKSKWEILDALVVLISFGLNIFLFNNKHMVMSVGGLLTLLRLWRITEIVNGKKILFLIFF